MTVGAVHFTSQIRLDRELGWSDLSDRAKFLGLSLFHKIHLNLTRPLIKTCMPSLKVNSHNTRTGVTYSRFIQNSVNFSKSFFPFFSKLWSTLSKDLKSQKDIIIFKENLKSIFHPKRYKHFKYGSKLGNKCLSHLRLGRSFLNSHWDRYVPQRLILFNKIEALLPGFKTKSKKRQLFILLNGIYLDSEHQDCRNKHIMFAMQQFILNTKLFEKPS